MREYFIVPKIGPTTAVDIYVDNENDKIVRPIGVECDNVDTAKLVIEALEARDLRIWNEEN